MQMSWKFPQTCFSMGNQKAWLVSMSVKFCEPTCAKLQKGIKEGSGPGSVLSAQPYGQGSRLACVNHALLLCVLIEERETHPHEKVRGS